LARVKALLFDLDDTLLLNNTQEFLAHYYRALLDKVKGVCAPGRFAEALNAGIRAMWQNRGYGPTNAEIFDAEFFGILRLPREAIVPVLQEFYDRDFEALRIHTQPDPWAVKVVALAREKGLQLAIATQPVFPRSAILARLRWAGVPHEQFNYDLVTSYENMRACKPRRRYFEDILDALHRTPEEALMVGDSPEADLAAAELGIKTFWVVRDASHVDKSITCDARGTLEDLYELIRSGGIHEL